jgi:hypothetical protein
MRLRFCPRLIVAGPALLLLMAPPAAFGQTAATGVTCVPVSERAGHEFGCFILATQTIGPLDSAHAHDSAAPATSPASDWSPKGLCKT